MKLWGWDPHCRITVFIRRGREHSLCVSRTGYVSKEWEGGCLQARKRAFTKNQGLSPLLPWPWTFQPLKLWEINVCSISLPAYDIFSRNHENFPEIPCKERLSKKINGRTCPKVRNHPHDDHFRWILSRYCLAGGHNSPKPAAILVFKTPAAVSRMLTFTLVFMSMPFVQRASCGAFLVSTLPLDCALLIRK